MQDELRHDVEDVFVSVGACQSELSSSVCVWMHAQGSTYSQIENKSEHGYMVHLSWQSCYTIPAQLDTHLRGKEQK